MLVKVDEKLWLTLDLVRGSFVGKSLKSSACAFLL